MVVLKFHDMYAITHPQWHLEEAQGSVGDGLVTWDTVILNVAEWNIGGFFASI